MKDLFDRRLRRPRHLPARPPRRVLLQRASGRPRRRSALASAHPDKLTYNHNFDPRDGEAGLDQLRDDAERLNLKGVKLYTAEWHGDSRGWRLDDPWAYRYFEVCRELGIRTSTSTRAPPSDRWTGTPSTSPTSTTRRRTSPTSTSSSSTCGLPRLEDFCWIATQEPNVHGGLAVAMPFIHTRPRYFAQIMGELLYWIGEDRIQFSSDYAIWTPRWLVEAFVDFQIPEDMTEYAPITTEQKQEDSRSQRRQDVRHPGARRQLAARARAPTRPPPVPAPSGADLAGAVR